MNPRNERRGSSYGHPALNSLHAAMEAVQQGGICLKDLVDGALHREELGSVAVTNYLLFRIADSLQDIAIAMNMQRGDQS